MPQAIVTDSPQLHNMRGPGSTNHNAASSPHGIPNHNAASSPHGIPNHNAASSPHGIPMGLNGTDHNMTLTSVSPGMSEKRWALSKVLFCAILLFEMHIRWNRMNLCALAVMRDSSADLSQSPIPMSHNNKADDSSINVIQQGTSAGASSYYRESTATIGKNSSSNEKPSNSKVFEENPSENPVSSASENSPVSSASENSPVSAEKNGISSAEKGNGDESSNNDEALPNKEGDLEKNRNLCHCPGGIDLQVFDSESVKAPTQTECLEKHCPIVPKSLPKSPSWTEAVGGNRMHACAAPSFKETSLEYRNSLPSMKIWPKSCAGKPFVKYLRSCWEELRPRASDFWGQEGAGANSGNRSTCPLLYAGSLITRVPAVLGLALEENKLFSPRCMRLFRHFDSISATTRPIYYFNPMLDANGCKLAQWAPRGSKCASHAFWNQDRPEVLPQPSILDTNLRPFPQMAKIRGKKRAEEIRRRILFEEAEWRRQAIMENQQQSPDYGVGAELLRVHGGEKGRNKLFMSKRVSLSSSKENYMTSSEDILNNHVKRKGNQNHEKSLGDEKKSPMTNEKTTILKKSPMTNEKTTMLDSAKTILDAKTEGEKRRILSTENSKTETATEEENSKTETYIHLRCGESVNGDLGRPTTLEKARTYYSDPNYRIEYKALGKSHRIIKDAPAIPYRGPFKLTEETEHFLASCILRDGKEDFLFNVLSTDDKSRQSRKKNVPQKRAKYTNYFFANAYSSILQAKAFDRMSRLRAPKIKKMLSEKNKTEFASRNLENLETPPVEQQSYDSKFQRALKTEDDFSSATEDGQRNENWIRRKKDHTEESRKLLEMDPSNDQSNTKLREVSTVSESMERLESTVSEISDRRFPREQRQDTFQQDKRDKAINLDKKKTRAMKEKDLRKTNEPQKDKRKTQKDKKTNERDLKEKGRDLKEEERSKKDPEKELIKFLKELDDGTTEMPDVLDVYIDALGREMFLTIMEKTMQQLQPRDPETGLKQTENYGVSSYVNFDGSVVADHKNKRKEPDPILHEFFDFTRMHKCSRSTQMNYMPMYVGEKFRSSRKTRGHDCPMDQKHDPEKCDQTIFNYYKDLGYITANFQYNNGGPESSKNEYSLFIIY